MKTKIKKPDVIEIEVSKEILKQLQNRKPPKPYSEHEKKK